MRSRALSLAALALLVGLCGGLLSGPRPAAAQALDAGKPPAQIFSGTCSACHRSPRGLVRNVAPGSLPGFLRQHYTTGNEMAGTMAAYVLGNGGTERVAEPPAKREPPPKQEPKQRPKDAPDVAARSPESKEQPKRPNQQKAGKKGAEPAAKDSQQGEPDKVEAVKPETPALEPVKTEADCKVEEPKPVANAPAAGFAMPTPAASTPRQPTALLTLPGFPAPVPEPEPEQAATAGTQPGCEPSVGASTASARVNEPPKEAAREKPAETPAQREAAAPAAPIVAEPPKPEPLRPAVAETPPPVLDIMQEEVHGPRPARPAAQKKKQ